MTEEDVDLDKQMTHVCVDDSDHILCPCVVVHARRVMRHWTGTNCSWVDDDVTALGILAGMAIEAGLYRGVDSLPATMIDAIERHRAHQAVVLRDAD